MENANNKIVESLGAISMPGYKQFNKTVIEIGVQISKKAS